MSDKPTRENKRQHQAFLVYSSMSDPSVQNMWETWGKIGGLSEYKRPSFRTLELWCTKYQWVERSEAIHREAKAQVTRKTIEQLAMAKEEVLAMTRVVMIRYGQQLQENTQGRLTISDFEKAWKIQRIELGLPTEIGEHEVKADLYAGMSGEKLVKELESLTERYKEKLKEELKS